MRLLVIEDEKKTATFLESTLRQEGFDICLALDGESGFLQALSGGFDVILTDIMLPKLDGLSLVREIRRRGTTTPVLMLSARGEVEQRVEGLDAGADDYLPKPFATSELLARVRSLLRRNGINKTALLTVGDLDFDPSTRETRRTGRRVELSMRETLLLECLLKADGSVVSRRDIITAVWGYDFDPGTNIVEVYVRRLRDKIDRSSPTPLIHTIRGLGYAIRELP